MLIDQEVRKIVERAYDRAIQLLRENIDKLKLLADTLLEREVLDNDEMNRLLRGEKLPPVDRRHDDGDRPAATLAPINDDTPHEPGVEPFGPPAPRPAGA